MGDLGHKDSVNTAYYALDKQVFRSSKSGEERTYTADSIVSVAFLPSDDGQAALFTTFDQEKHMVSFYPDTTSDSAWKRFFRDSSGIKQESVFGRLVLTDCTNTRDTTNALVFSWYNTSYYPHSRQVNTPDIRIVSGDKTCLVPLGPEMRQMGLWDTRMVGRLMEVVDIFFPGGIYQEDADISHGGGTREFPYLQASGRFLLGTRNLELTLLEPYETGDRYALMINYYLYAQPSETHPEFRPVVLQFQLFQLFLSVPIDDSKHPDN